MRIAVAVAVLFGVASALGHAQSAPLRFKQVREGVAPAHITPQELNELGDPLFTLVLKEKSNLVNLADVESALQPDGDKRKLFVVAEQIVSSARNSSRRSVLTFSGINGGQTLDGNVMLSVSFNSTGIEATPDIEAWG